ncbi:MAG: hypothetical protein SVU32_00615, partial [Candidatus Nanohaloarchaea archaeon]|nr:hypothetical protein [Candidatus Nanohaloarchaea archaeon]
QQRQQPQRDERQNQSGQRSVNAGQEKEDSSEEASLRQDVPEAPETREINVPEMEKGPLFIRVAKFKEAKNLVTEMQQLNQELETQMGGLQNTLEEDRQTNRKLQDTLKKLEDSMKTIRNIVSP